MQFIVTGRGLDSPVVPPQQELALVKASFESFKSRTNPKIKAIYPHADERAVTLVIEADSGDDLTRVLGSIPAFRLSSFESHPVTTPEAVLGVIAEMERAMAGMAVAR